MNSMKNVGKTDRIIRLALAVGLFTIGIIKQDYLYVEIGFIPLMTAIFGWCLIYRLFGICTISHGNVNDKTDHSCGV